MCNDINRYKINTLIINHDTMSHDCEISRVISLIPTKTQIFIIEKLLSSKIILTEDFQFVDGRNIKHIILRTY